MALSSDTSVVMRSREVSQEKLRTFELNVVKTLNAYYYESFHPTHRLEMLEFLHRCVGNEPSPQTSAQIVGEAVYEYLKPSQEQWSRMRSLADTAIDAIELLLNTIDHPSDRDHLATLLQLYAKKPGFHRHIGDFGYFMRLPAEIQTKIWKFSLPGPELVRVTLTPLPRGSIEHILSVERPVNPMFDVCWESRRIATAKYPVQLMKYPSSLRNIPRRIIPTHISHTNRIDPTKDTLWPKVNPRINHPNDFDIFGMLGSFSNNIQYLVVDQISWDRFESHTCCFVRALPHLQQVTLVFNEMKQRRSQRQTRWRLAKPESFVQVDDVDFRLTGYTVSNRAQHLYGFMLPAPTFQPSSNSSTVTIFPVDSLRNRFRALWQHGWTNPGSTGMMAYLFLAGCRCRKLSTGIMIPKVVILRQAIEEYNEVEAAGRVL